METGVDALQKTHGRFNECFRYIVSHLLFGGFLNTISLTSATVITIIAFRKKAELYVLHFYAPYFGLK